MDLQPKVTLASAPSPTSLLPYSQPGSLNSKETTIESQLKIAVRVRGKQLACGLVPAKYSALTALTAPWENSFSLVHLCSQNSGAAYAISYTLRSSLTVRKPTTAEGEPRIPVMALVRLCSKSCFLHGQSLSQPTRIPCVPFIGVEAVKHLQHHLRHNPLMNGIVQADS